MINNLKEDSREYYKKLSFYHKNLFKSVVSQKIALELTMESNENFISVREDLILLEKKYPGKFETLLNEQFDEEELQKTIKTNLLIKEALEKKEIEIEGLKSIVFKDEVLND